MLEGENKAAKWELLPLIAALFSLYLEASSQTK